MLELTIVAMQRQMEQGAVTCATLAQEYLARIDAIDRHGPALSSVLEINPEALLIAAALDEERANGHVRGPLHGIPILIKDNIDTADAMQTTAGSLALVGAPAPHDAGVVTRLRAAGALILGKTNLSEWANFRSFTSTSGWSGRNGRTRNPHALDRSTSGSSSGSAAAVAANLCAAALGTETDGSVVSPSSACGIVGIKTTLGLISRAGVIPIAASQDTVGIHSRSVADGAALLGVLTGSDSRDPSTSESAGRGQRDYTRFLHADGLRGARIGVVRNAGFWGYSQGADQIGESALEMLRRAGATVIDPTNLPSGEALDNDFSEWLVLLYEFKRDLNAYLATRPGLRVSTLADIIRFNRDQAPHEMPWFAQELLELAEADLFTAEEYAQARTTSLRLARTEGIDAVMDELELDALVAPTTAPAWVVDLIHGDRHMGGSSTPAAVAGYPAVTVPAGMWCGLPVGFSFMGRAWSEPVLLRLAHAFEQAAQARRPPSFAPTLAVGGHEMDASARVPPFSVDEYIARALSGQSPTPNKRMEQFVTYIARRASR